MDADVAGRHYLWYYRFYIRCCLACWMINVFVPVGPLQYFTDTRQITYATTPTILSPSREASTLAVRVRSLANCWRRSVVQARAPLIHASFKGTTWSYKHISIKKTPNSRFREWGIAYNVEIGSQVRDNVVVGRNPVTGGSGTAGIGDDIRTIPLQNGWIWRQLGQ